MGRGLPWAPIGNRWQPTATVFACLSRFQSRPICRRLPLVAPARLFLNASSPCERDIGTSKLRERSASRPLVAIAWRSRVSVEKPRLVGKHHRLDAVAEVELLEYVGDVRLDGRVADVELASDLRVRKAADDQAEHVELALTEIVELSRRRWTWNARELFDQAFRDAGGKQRLSAGDDADCGEELFGRVVLEHEPARAGA